MIDASQYYNQTNNGFIRRLVVYISHLTPPKSENPQASPQRHHRRGQLSLLQRRSPQNRRLRTVTHPWELLCRLR
jgi:hypothetical protein